eukprot:gnl/Spiro4/26028_TR12967_c0_g1_i1.p1 gnl/Spiro4/26028_TR12967_c0_g1~~gnl/Spiro4/26028_TR12967_c0_g1_i1.p1  ORF type:complete len:1069 (-),score=293.63 gnl/Spiro4/26028_TR12967_c0_g1_i1:127-3333(-)
MSSNSSLQPRTTPPAAFGMAPEVVLDFFQVDPHHGLSHRQVKDHAERYGANEIPEPDPTPFWKLVLSQFEDLLVLILLGAAVVSFLLAVFNTGEDRFSAFVEPVVILLILVANATVGVLQESRAEAAIAALKRLEAREATVLRAGQWIKMDALEVVVGDIVELAVGAAVPADVRLIEITSTTLMCDQCVFTGESRGVHKTVKAVEISHPIVQDQTCMLFAGTFVTRGTARGVVVAVGVHTMLGTIQTGLQEADDQVSPLKQKLEEFGKLLAQVIAVICGLVWLINIGHFSDPSHGGFMNGAVYYFKIAVALAVAAIPEGLPAVVTTCLALGTRRMALKNAIVRKLPAVETLGCTTIICSDKTGTLTTNMMSVTRALAVLSVDAAAHHEQANLLELEVDGTSYNPLADVSAKGYGVIARPAVAFPVLCEMAQIASLCNEADIFFSVRTNNFEVRGDATEAALKVLVEKLGLPNSEAPVPQRDFLDPLRRANYCNTVYASKFHKVKTFEFSRERKCMSVLVTQTPSAPPPSGSGSGSGSGSSSGSGFGGDSKTDSAQNYSLFVKGAHETILDRCCSVLTNQGTTEVMTENMRRQLVERADAMCGSENLRVLALAMRRVGAFKGSGSSATSGTDADNEADREVEFYESNLVFVGLVGMMDPPRPEVREAIEQCHTAGVRVLVITGDNQKTAEAVCRRVGVFGWNESTTGLSYTGYQFDAMSPEQKFSALQTARLFSRVAPSHKVELIRELQQMREIVAMTGDGVNDSIALRQAEIGIAMGSGTDVAKCASAMVLADDNFSTIVMAIEEGRGIYNNMKQFIRYLISSNIGEVVCIFLTACVGMPDALIPVQLLWVNLVTDGLPATALSFNPTEDDLMTRPPRSRDEPIVTRWLFFRYLVIGLYIGVSTVAGFAWWYMYYVNGPHLTWEQLTTYSKCHLVAGNDCSVFKAHEPSTMSLSILVTIEMFNALNSLSENQSLLQLPPWKNWYLLAAIALSFALHFMILYVPFLAMTFSVVPLGSVEWLAVVLFSLPVVFIDEALKFIARSPNMLTTSSSSSSSRHKYEPLPSVEIV